jgi:hypothetical protein
MTSKASFHRGSPARFLIAWKFRYKQCLEMAQTLSSPFSAWLNAVLAFLTWMQTDASLFFLPFRFKTSLPPAIAERQSAAIARVIRSIRMLLLKNISKYSLVWSYKSFVAGLRSVLFLIYRSRNFSNVGVRLQWTFVECYVIDINARRIK